jgi:hypothetical protein
MLLCLTSQLKMGARIAQSVYRLARTGRSGDRIPVEAVLWLTQPPVQWVPSHSPGLKWPGRGVDYTPHLAPRLKKEYSCTSNPPLGLRDLY